jgi:hypothetical protein
MRSTCAVLGCLIACPVVAFAGGKTIVVTGQNDSSIDRPAIQAAIDAAPKNGTVLLQGTFQLDGVELFVRKSHLAIVGIALDNDGDHRVNEDWADGQDNDGDGAIDEDDWDAVLQGVLDGSGQPDQGSFPAEPGNPGRSLFNRGIAVQADDNVVIRDLKFTGMTRGVAFGGEILVQPGVYCDEIQRTHVLTKNSAAERNLFDNMQRGVQVFGVAKNVVFRDNIMINEGLGAPILVVGDAAGCWENDETPRPEGFLIGRPEGTQITGNYVAHRNRYVIQIVAGDSTMLRDNTTEDVGSSLYVADSPRTQVIGNWLLSPHLDVGLQFFDTAPNSSAGSQIQNNRVESVADGWEAIGLYGDTTGVKASNNTFPNGDVNYYLGAGTHDNTVVLRQGQTAYDDGTDNKLIGGGS